MYPRLILPNKDETFVSGKLRGCLIWLQLMGFYTPTGPNHHNHPPINLPFWKVPLMILGCLELQPGKSVLTDYLEHWSSSNGQCTDWPSRVPSASIICFQGLMNPAQKVMVSINPSQGRNNLRDGRGCTLMWQEGHCPGSPSAWMRRLPAQNWISDCKS